MREFRTTTVEETIALGARLGALVGAGDFIELEGPLGAGKSRFVEGLARGLGVDPDARIPSPTFTIVNEHQGRVRLVHADFYRIESPEELVEIGWDDYVASPSVIAVEWLSRAGSAPDDRVTVTIELDGEERIVRIAATGPRSEQHVAALR